jgi:hypothetical protein
MGTTVACYVSGTHESGLPHGGIWHAGLYHHGAHAPVAEQSSWLPTRKSKSSSGTKMPSTVALCKAWALFEDDHHAVALRYDLK